VGLYTLDKGSVSEGVCQSLAALWVPSSYKQGYKKSQQKEESV
jgi:hypothetical protein